MVKVLIKKLNSSVKLPSYKTNGASGMDLMACIEKPINLEAGKSCLVPTGLSVAFPNEYEIQKFETSNIASNRMKINGLPFYWSVYEDDNDDEIIYLDINDTYNEVKGSQHDYMIFPNTGFLKQ